METLIAIIAAFGIVNILSKGSIFQSLRDWSEFHTETIHKLITCPMCLGFWLGLFLGIAYGPFPWWNPLNGAFYSATTWIIHCIVQFFGGGYDPARTINIVTTEPIKIQEEKSWK
jgi:hypothetical protein